MKTAVPNQGRDSPPTEIQSLPLSSPKSQGLVEWLLACPEQGFFIPIESESTDAL
jgi:hypothetical protein